MVDRGETRDPAHAEHRSNARPHRALVSATFYYTVALAFATGFYLAVWSVLRDNAADSPGATALVASCIIVVGSIVLREYFFRRAPARHAESKKRAVQQDLSEEMHQGERTAATKLSVDRNSTLLREIKKRSDAANVLSKVSAAHKEVFEACAEYLTLIESELQSMKPGSPRLEPFLKGRVRAAEAHRFHMLRWAELEATELTVKAREERSPEAVREAIWVLDTAIESYPAERPLIESRAVLGELKISIEVASLISLAESQMQKRDFAAAARTFRDALFALAQDHVNTPERREVADRIKQKLDEIGMA